MKFWGVFSYNQRTTSVKQICETVGICKATLYKYMKNQESENVCSKF